MQLLGADSVYPNTSIASAASCLPSRAYGSLPEHAKPKCHNAVKAISAEEIQPISWQSGQKTEVSIFKRKEKK
jgi:hypothetical protein